MKTEHYDGPEYRTGYELRAAAADPGVTSLTFARFGEWNRIWDPWEGDFLEQPVRGAFAETFAERGSSIKVLFNHGHDPAFGQKALGIPERLEETERGPAIDIRWLDRPYVDDIRAGIPPAVERSAYGSSYMFKVLEDQWVMDPERSEHNPDGIPERLLLRVDVREIGLVTFAADAETENLVGVRSLTSRFVTPPPQHDRESSPSEHLGPAAARADRDTKRAQIATAFTLNRRARR